MRTCAAAGRVENWPHQHEYLGESSMLAITVALTFTVLGGMLPVRGAELKVAAPRCTG